MGKTLERRSSEEPVFSEEEIKLFNEIGLIVDKKRGFVARPVNEMFSNSEESPYPSRKSSEDYLSSSE